MVGGGLHHAEGDARIGAISDCQGSVNRPSIQLTLWSSTIAGLAHGGDGDECTHSYYAPGVPAYRGEPSRSQPERCAQGKPFGCDERNTQVNGVQSTVQQPDQCCHGREHEWSAAD